MPTAIRGDTLRSLRWLADTRTPIIVIGGVAAALQGGPQQPGDGQVEFVSADPFATDARTREAGLTPTDTDERWADGDRRAPWALPDGGTIALASNVPGTSDYPDLCRSARRSNSTTARAFRVGLRWLGRFPAARGRRAASSSGARFGRWHARSLRAMAQASAEDVRDVLPRVDIPSFLVYGEHDVRAPLTVAAALHVAISGSRLVVLPDAGHLCNLEAPDEFNAAIRDFLHNHRS